MDDLSQQTTDELENAHVVLARPHECSGVSQTPWFSSYLYTSQIGGGHETLGHMADGVKPRTGAQEVLSPRCLGKLKQRQTIKIG